VGCQSLRNSNHFRLSVFYVFWARDLRAQALTQIHHGAPECSTRAPLLCSPRRSTLKLRHRKHASVLREPHVPQHRPDGEAVAVVRAHEPRHVVRLDARARRDRAKAGDTKRLELRGAVGEGEDEVVRAVAVDQPARDDAAKPPPPCRVGGGGQAEQNRVLDDAGGARLMGMGTGRWGIQTHGEQTPWLLVLIHTGSQSMR